MTEKVATAPAASSAGKAEKVEKKLLAIAAVGAALAVVGVVLWVVQLSGGMVQTGMRNFDSWSLYITSFMFFVGLSAGGLIISSIPGALGVSGFGGIAKVAIWTSICCTVAAVAFVVIDLGSPLRVWELLVYSNLSLPLMWDIIVISTYLVLSVVYLWANLRAERGLLSRVTLRVLSVAALVVAVLVHSVTAWIFALNASHEFWHTALLAPWFVSSALVCGTALVMVVCIALRRAGYLGLEQSQIVRMAKMLGAFVLVDLYFFGCDLLTAGFPASAEGLAIVGMLVSGPLAPFFWTEVAGCAACAVVCLVPALRRSGLLVAGALLAIAGIFCKRVQLLVGGFQVPNLEMAGPMNEYTATFWQADLPGAYAGMVYWPTPLEFGVTLGVVGLAAALLFLGLANLPLKPTEGSH